MAAPRQSAPTEETASTRAPLRRRSRGNALTVIIIGSFMLTFWALVTTLQIQTTEGYINGTQTDNILQPQWSVWLQLPKLVFGDGIPGPAIPSEHAVGVIIGQGMEIFFLALIAGYEIAIHSSQKFGQILGGFMRIASFLIVFFDFFSDANYGNVSPFAHFAFAAFCAFTVGFGLTWGLALIEYGWKRA
jgi:hypothetical protein